MKRAMLAMAVVALALPAVAQAKPHRYHPYLWPSRNDVWVAAVRVADRAWPDNPCNGHVSVLRNRDADLTRQWEADKASGSTDGEVSYGAYADPARCRVLVASRYEGIWPELCTLLVHEWGHLAGRSHSPEPADVMYSGAPAIWPACRGLQAYANGGSRGAKRRARRDGAA